MVAAHIRIRSSEIENNIAPLVIDWRGFVCKTSSLRVHQDQAIHRI
jgi:hypothetical protein